jgi:hypothetical protein
VGVSNRSFDSAIAATPSDTTLDPSGPFQAMLIWKSGTVSFLDQAGNASGASDSILAGTTLWVKGVRVNLTGTSATVLLLKAPA